MLVRNIGILSTGSPHTSSNTEASFAAHSSSSAPLQPCSHTHKSAHAARASGDILQWTCYSCLSTDGEPQSRPWKTGEEGAQEDWATVLIKVGVRWEQKGQVNDERRRGREGEGSGCCRSRANVIKQYVWSMSKCSNPNPCAKLCFYFFSTLHN